MSAKPKVLIVDDDPAFAKMLAQYFRTHRYDVSEADNLEDALSLFRRLKPKAVLLDFNMPVVSGEKFLPLLQSMDPTVRVIVITGEIAEAVREKFQGLGYFAFFEKGGMALEDLRQKVDEALHY